MTALPAELTPTMERFRRLARSSPWRWHTLEFTWTTADAGQGFRGWVRRPGGYRVETVDGHLVSAATVACPRGGGFRPDAGPWTDRPGTWPHEVPPIWDTDGLIAMLPPRADVDYHSGYCTDPYTAAMLVPVELTESWIQDRPGFPVEIDEVRPIDHHGRQAWQALARPTSSYSPRHRRAPLLRGGMDTETGLWVPDGVSVVRLDVQTGICVFVGHAPTHCALDVRIDSVDRPLEDHLFVDDLRS